MQKAYFSLTQRIIHPHASWRFVLCLSLENYIVCPSLLLVDIMACSFYVALWKVFHSLSLWRIIGVRVEREVFVSHLGLQAGINLVLKDDI